MELLIIAIACCLGIIMGLYFKISIVFYFICLIFVIFVVKKEKIRTKNKENIINIRKYLLLFSIVLLIFYLYIVILENQYSFIYSNYNYNNENVRIIGTIVSEGNSKGNKVTYIVKIEKIDNKKIKKKIKILLNIKANKCNLKYGDKIEIFGKLENPSEERNEGGFNYRNYLKTKGISKIVNIKNIDVKLIEEKNINVILIFINNIREKIRNGALKILPEKEANFLIGILIGDKENIDENIKENFRNSNLSHILAVSGMHVSYMVFGVQFSLKLIRISKKKIKVFVVLFLIFFMLLTGCTPSVERACIMSIYLIIGSLINKKVKVINSICFSLIIILLFNPYSINDIGFLLSFGGTIGIVFLYPVLRKKTKKEIKEKDVNSIEKKNIFFSLKEKIKDIIMVTISANIMIFPIMLYNFNTVSTIFIISNLLISPIIGIVLILGYLLIILSYILFPIAKIMSFILKILIDIILEIANILGNLPFSKFYFITPKISIILMYYLFIIIIIYCKKQIISLNQIKLFIPKIFKSKKIIKNIIVIFTIFLVIVNFIIPKILQNELKIYFIDVGQR